jgi:uncharacterized protein YbaR (Trm112 family)
VHSHRRRPAFPVNNGIPRISEKHALHLDEQHAEFHSDVRGDNNKPDEALVPLVSRRMVSTKLVLDQVAAVRDKVPVMLMAMRVLRTAYAVTPLHGYGNYGGGLYEQKRFRVIAGSAT